MFKKGNWYEEPRSLLKHRLERSDHAQQSDQEFLRRMVEIEYGLRLMENLNIEQEPITAVPDLLTLHQLPALKHLTDDGWQLIVFARYRIPNYISRQRWYDDLREYSQMPTEAKLYAVNTNLPFDQQSLSDILQPINFPEHMEVYDRILRLRPPYQRASYKSGGTGKTYHFYAIPEKSGHRYPVSVEIPSNIQITHPEWVSAVPKIDDDRRFDQYIRTRQKPEREPIQLQWDAHIVADARIMQDKNAKSNWFNRVTEMHLKTEANDTTFYVDGQLHLVGMVGAGKSTLVKAISHHVVRTTPDKRIAVIVPSTMEAFNFANELNHLLECNWNTPAAVVYYGWTSRDKHIRAFLNEYGNDPTHFGHRWISSACGLMSLISLDDIASMGSAPRPGTEPCETLAASPLEQRNDTDEKFKQPSQDVTCPFFAQCPSHQKLRDLAQARVIVTTAGALQSRLPVFFDPRRPLLADYIYEQADIVFVDEADEVQAFEDDQFVNMVPLWNLPKALFSAADASVSEALRRDALNEVQESWSFSLREGPKYILPMLRMLNQTGSKSLSQWIGRSYFSAYRLFQTVARRMVGVPDWLSINEMTPEEADQYSFLSEIFSLLTAHDFTKIPDPDLASPESIRQYGKNNQVFYGVKLRDILYRATANVPRDLEDDLLLLMKNLLKGINVSLEESLLKLENGPRESNGKRDKPLIVSSDRETEKSLAHKLMFCLLAAGLDREIRTIVYNADSQPNKVSSVLDVRDFNSSFRSTHPTLPIAYTGSVFGTYYTPDERQPEQTEGKRGQQEVLARLEYINPGRELLLRFHELYQMFGIHGPHVVFLSGTSYLPDSTRWHIRTPIGAVLQANPLWSEAIQQHSEYHFSPALDAENKPIRISGAGNTSNDSDNAKKDALRLIARFWGENSTLEKQLAKLKELGNDAPEYWRDRARLLLFVNSYSQAQVLGQAIRQYTKGLSEDQVQWLKASDDEIGLDGLARSSIEAIVETDTQILVAPLTAIGRGHNILTADKQRAAFGAAYFVVRPLNPPGDVNGIAAEINAYGASWLSPDNPHSQIAERLTISEQETELRQLALEHWHRGERRTHYSRLNHQERNDLGATTLGRFVQASGRLVRGGVPMIIHFIDAAWAPNSAERQANLHQKSDNPTTSLLVEMICRLKHYTREDDVVGRILYQPFIGLFKTTGLFYNEENCNDK